jgi:acid phosphatase
MIQQHRCRWTALASLAVSVAGLSLAPASAWAGVSFLGVASGDASSTDATLWTRAVDTNSPAVISLTAQVTTDSTFATGVQTFSVSTDATKDYTAKLNVTGLLPGTRYYYRFTTGTVTSGAGTFKTAPDAATATPVHFAFSGDLDGLMRPYPASHNFNQLDLDFFVFLGDLIYETASTGSPAVTSTASATATQLFNDFSRKYREQFIAVNSGGQNGLQTLFAAQGNYSLFDNHELGNKQYINGGAPAGGAVGGMSSGAGVDATNPANDVNNSATSAEYMNHSPGFQTIQRVFFNYEPIKDRGLVSNPSDVRSDGTPKQYFAQQWGKNAIFVNVDDRSYRDIRMKTAGGADDTGSRGDNLNRTMLGATQLAWLEQTLLDAQNAGTPWKFVAVSSPIDQIGPIGGTLTGTTNGGNNGYAPVNSDGGKSWMGEYRAERNALMKFIADHHIYNVVFLTTDDHQNRVNELTYSPSGQTSVQSTYVKVPRCFLIVDGPLAATGPDFVTNHAFANNKLIADGIANAQKTAGIDPIGLDPRYPGLHDVVRESDPEADALRQPIDFYSPDTFNYNTLDVSPDGKTLTVKTFGINSYAQNSRPEFDAVNNPIREILSFQVDAAGDSLAAIDHIILVYQENWSFDALYGSFPGANGLANASATALNQLDRLSGLSISSLSAYDPVSRAIPTQNPPVPLNGSNVQDPRFLANPAATNGPLVGGLDTLLPYNLAPHLAPTDLTGDIVHRYWQEQFQIDDGKMDMFVSWSDNPGLVMSHFDATPLPEGLLAQQYVMCDNFFHSAFGGSFLNHQFLVAAQAPVYPNAASIVPNNVALLDTNGFLALNGSGRLVRDGNVTPIGGVAFVDPTQTFDKNYAVNTIFSANLAASGSPTAASLLPSQNNSNPNDLARPYIPTIGDRLDAANVSWKWYSGGWNNALLGSPSNPSHFGTTGTNASPLFQWHHQAFAFYDRYAPWTNGVRNPVSAAHLQDETNFFDDVANNTLPAVVFIKPLGPDNEHPGYASLQQGQMHVSNIVAAVKANPGLWAHTAIIVTYDEHGGRWDHVTPPVGDIWGPGSRVPGIVISPLGKTHYVDHTEHQTLSVLKTIEQRFGVPPLTQRDGTASSLASAFNSALTAIPSGVHASRGGYTLDRRTGRFVQKVRLVNNGTTPIPSPVLLVADGLSANASLFNADGTTASLAPLNSPYISADLGGDHVLSPGEMAIVTLEFTNPSRGGINYNTRVLAGTPAP